MKKSILALLLLASCLVNGLLFFLLKPIKITTKFSKPYHVKIKYNDGGTGFPRILSDVLKDKNILATYTLNDNECDILYNQYYSEMSNPRAVNAAIKIFYTGEVLNKRHMQDYDLYIGTEYIDHPKYARLAFGFVNGCSRGSNGDLNRYKTREKCNPNKEFACFLVTNGSNKYEATETRVQLFHALSLYKKVLSGGNLLNNTGYVVPRDETMKFLSQCKFVIAYENQAHPGYLTEKVFNAYFAGAVPIYYGHPTVLADINRKAVIYGGDFNNLTDLGEYVKKVDNDDKLYCKIYNENLVKRNQCDLMVNAVKQKFCRLLEEKIVKENLQCEYY